MPLNYITKQALNKKALGPKMRPNVSGENSLTSPLEWPNPPKMRPNVSGEQSLTSPYHLLRYLILIAPTFAHPELVLLDFKTRRITKTSPAERPESTVSESSMAITAVPS